ncbi:DNA primase [Marinobacteraceae bacterium S3BR75-40.1]
MSGLIPQSFIDNLLERTDLVEVVRRRIELKKKGGSFWACCPFHDERTPSFHVRPDKGFYHCFGCGANGDAISFVREFDHLAFTEAVEVLAGQLGMEVPYDKQAREEIQQARTLSDALDTANRFYQRSLQEHPAAAYARDYLKNRGLTPDIQQEYQLGFAPPQGDALAQAVDRPTLKALIETRTVSDRYGRPRDLFRNRVMFPIRNTRGRTVAFGGRTLGDDKAKYINSPESDVFHKSRTIYGLYEAMQRLRQLDKLLVVEGYMDVIALAQNGIGYAVACMGTATNTDSISALLRHARHLVFCFDGDAAGYRAADKAMENALELAVDGIHLQFLMLPEGEDPDSLVRKEGQAAFQQRIDQAVPLSSFLFNRKSEGLDLELPEDRGELSARIKPLLQKMPESTLKKALDYQLWRLQRGPFQGGRNKRPGFGKKGAEVMHDTALPSPQGGDKTVCAALLYRPYLASDWLNLLEQEAQFPASTAFASWIAENGLKRRDDVFLRLATSPGERSKFYKLFDNQELWLGEEGTVTSAEEVVDQLRQKRQRIQQIRAPMESQQPADDQ